MIYNDFKKVYIFTGDIINENKDYFLSTYHFHDNDRCGVCR